MSSHAVKKSTTHLSISPANPPATPFQAS